MANTNDQKMKAKVEEQTNFSTNQPVTEVAANDDTDDIFQLIVNDIMNDTLEPSWNVITEELGNTSDHMQWPDWLPADWTISRDLEDSLETPAPPVYQNAKGKSFHSKEEVTAYLAKQPSKTKVSNQPTTSLKRKSSHLGLEGNAEDEAQKVTVAMLPPLPWPEWLPSGWQMERTYDDPTVVTYASPKWKKCRTKEEVLETIAVEAEKEAKKVRQRIRNNDFVVVDMMDDDWVYYSDYEDLSDIEPEVANDPETTFHDSMTELAQDMTGFHIADVSGPQPRVAVNGLHTSRDQGLITNTQHASAGSTGPSLAQPNAYDRTRPLSINNLPDLWSYKRYHRKDGKTKDTVFFSPSMQRFRSLKAVREFLACLDREREEFDERNAAANATAEASANNASAEASVSANASADASADGSASASGNGSV